MACGCRKNANTKYLWTPPQGSSLPAQEFNTEIEAKARVMRKGGTYATVTKGN